MENRFIVQARVGRHPSQAGVRDIHFRHGGRRTFFQKDRLAREELRLPRRVEHAAVSLHIVWRMEMPNYRANHAIRWIRRRGRGQAIDQLRGNGRIVVQQNHEIGLMPQSEAGNQKGPWCAYNSTAASP